MQYTRFCNILDTKQGTLMCDGILKTVRISYGFFWTEKKKKKSNMLIHTAQSITTPRSEKYRY